MTTLLEDLRARLLSQVNPGGGIWYGVNTAEPATYPYIVVTRITSTANVALGGPSDLQNTRVQIDVVARRQADAMALAALVGLAMQAWTVQNVPISTVDIYEAEVKAHRVSMDYSVWSVD